MRYLIIILFIIPTISFGGEVLKCGEHPAEEKTHSWYPLASIKMDAVVQKVAGILCLGSKLNDINNIDKIIYRDNMNSIRKYSFQALLKKSHTLIDHTDLKVGIIRSGKIMTLKVSESQVYSDRVAYKISIRFLRNLAKFPTRRDHRELDLYLIKPNNSQGPTAYIDTKEEELFNILEIFISPALTLYKFNFKDFNILRRQAIAKKLKKIDKL